MTTKTKISKSRFIPIAMNFIGLLLVSGKHLPVFFAPDLVRDFLAFKLWPELFGCLFLLVAFVAAFFIQTSRVWRFLPCMIAAAFLVLGPWFLAAELRAVVWINDGRAANSFLNPFAGMILIMEPGNFDPRRGEVYFVYRRDPMSFLDGDAKYVSAELLVFEPNHGMKTDDPEVGAATKVINKDWYQFENPD